MVPQESLINIAVDSPHKQSNIRMCANFYPTGRAFFSPAIGQKLSPSKPDVPKIRHIRWLPNVSWSVWISSRREILWPKFGDHHDSHNACFCRFLYSAFNPKDSVEAALAVFISPGSALRSA